MNREKILEWYKILDERSRKIAKEVYGASTDNIVPMVSEHGIVIECTYAYWNPDWSTTHYISWDLYTCSDKDFNILLEKQKREYKEQLERAYKIRKRQEEEQEARREEAAKARQYQMYLTLKEKFEK